MTVADVIRELQALPQHLSVYVVPSSVVAAGDFEQFDMPLSDEDATEADEVRHMGPWVLIRGK